MTAHSERREANLRQALQVTSGFLAALCKQKGFGEIATRVWFTGDYAGYGIVTLGEVLDLAEATLANADTTEED